MITNTIPDANVTTLTAMFLWRPNIIFKILKQDISPTLTFVIDVLQKSVSRFDGTSIAYDSLPPLPICCTYVSLSVGTP